MWHGWRAADKFLEHLCGIDAEIAERTRRAGCAHCGGPLHVANYPRKPRGALNGELPETFALRWSFCCGRAGCRARATPPSVRFLGRKVYASVVVLIASVIAQIDGATRRIAELTEVPARTLKRWLTWWQTVFVASELWRSSRGRFMPAVPDDALPGGMIDAFDARDAEDCVCRVLRLVAPVTTESVVDGARFVREDP